MSRQLYEENGLDLSALAALDRVALAPIRQNTQYRWNFHWGKPETALDEGLYDPAVMRPFTVPGAAAMTVSYPAYFETWEKPLDPDFAGYFQNADVKPHGRFFLKELAFNLAAADSQRMVIGAQPLGTLGREAETREFVRAYSALPKLPFRSVPGADDPVTLRYLPTDNGTYFYLVSMAWQPITAAPSPAPENKAASKPGKRRSRAAAKPAETAEPAPAQSAPQDAEEPAGTAEPAAPAARSRRSGASRRRKRAERSKAEKA